MKRNERLRDFERGNIPRAERGADSLALPSLGPRLAKGQPKSEQNERIYSDLS